MVMPPFCFINIKNYSYRLNTRMTKNDNDDVCYFNSYSYNKDKKRIYNCLLLFY